MERQFRHDTVGHWFRSEYIDHGPFDFHKAPRIVEFVNALPKSGSGKVMWRALQEREASVASAS